MVSSRNALVLVFVASLLHCAPASVTAARPDSNLGDCPFPPESDAAGIDQATVMVEVALNAEGNVESTSATEDPGYGFARQAQQCARDARYSPARDDRGRGVSQTLSLRFRFLRPPPSDEIVTAAEVTDKIDACAFPREANLAGVDRATVMVKVALNARGEVLATTATTDPGHGFAAAAERCARRARYSPARDAHGARSPQILTLRFRFRRRGSALDR